MKLTPQSIAYHRNGIAGEPFYVVLFRNETEKQNMIGIIPADCFTDDETTRPENGRCYVLDVDMLTQGNIRFGENSWREDQYEAQLREMIDNDR